MCKSIPISFPILAFPQELKKNAEEEMYDC